MWFEAARMTILSSSEYIKHCIMRNEIMRGKRFTCHELKNVHWCCSTHYFQECLVYDEKMARDFAYIFAQVIKDFMEKAESADEVGDVNNIWSI